MSSNLTCPATQSVSRVTRTRSAKVVRPPLAEATPTGKFLENQLKPQLLKNACAKAGVPLTLRMHEGYDHSYFFISSFIEDHLRWHAQRLKVTTAR